MTLTRLEQMYAALEGNWHLCSPFSSNLFESPMDAIGIEFGPGSSAPVGHSDSVGGPAYFLVQGPSGPVRGAGFAYELTYEVAPWTSQQFMLQIQRSGTDAWLSTFRYSPSPREFELEGNPKVILTGF